MVANPQINHVTKFEVWNKESGKAYDVTRSVHNINWHTDLASAAQLTFSVLRGDFEFIPWEGNEISFAWNGIQIFKGIVFKRTLTDDEVWDIIAYGNSRYLKGTGTYMWKASSSSDRFKRIMKDLSLSHKILDSNPHKKTEEITDGSTFFDMINTAASHTLRQTGERFIVMDAPNGDVLHVNTERLATNLLIGDKSSVTSFSFTSSIEETSNIVQLIHEDSDKKVRQLKVARSNKSVEKWGPLVHTESVTDKVNSAQLQARANAKLKELNKREQTFTLKCLGDTRIRAGSSLYVDIADVRGVGVPKNQRVLVTSCSHGFDNKWIMDLEVILI